jgi:YNFM family putative membrane transporter
MRRSLPPEPALPAASRFSPRTVRRLLGNRELIAATLAGSASFGAFMGVFSYIDFRLEGAPFSLSPALIGLVFVLWVMGAAGPAAGRLAGQVGWRRVAAGALAIAAAGLTVSLVNVLAVVIAGLALVTLGNFSCVTAAQLGVAGATDRDRGLASAMYFSAYYAAGAVGAYVPGLAWEAWGWPGVWGLAVGAQLAGIAAVAATRLGGHGASTDGRAQPRGA